MTPSREVLEEYYQMNYRIELPDNIPEAKKVLESLLSAYERDLEDLRRRLWKLEQSSVPPDTYGGVSGPLPQSSVSQEAKQALTQILHTSDGGKSTEEATTPRLTQTKPTTSGYTEEQVTGPTVHNVALLLMEVLLEVLPKVPELVGLKQASVADEIIYKFRDKLSRLLAYPTTKGPGDDPEQQYKDCWQAVVDMLDVFQSQPAQTVADVRRTQSEFYDWAVAWVKLNRSLPIPPPALQQTGVEGEWQVEKFETGASLVTGDMQYGLTDGFHHIFLGTTRKEMADSHAKYLNSLTQSRPACEHWSGCANVSMHVIRRSGGMNEPLQELVQCGNCFIAYWRNSLPQPEGGE